MSNKTEITIQGEDVLTAFGPLPAPFTIRPDCDVAALVRAFPPNTPFALYLDGKVIFETKLP